MKSQDIFLLLKIASLEAQESAWLGAGEAPNRTQDWTDWEEETDPGHVWSHESSTEDIARRSYSVRALAESTGIGKSQISISLNSCMSIELIRRDRKTGVPRANKKALYEFIVYGLRFVFPAAQGALTRGIGTAFAAPVLKEHVFSAGELVPVWPDPRGKTKGQTVEPLFATVPAAVRRDPALYELLALVDAIRIGKPRERNIASALLQTKLGAK